MGEKTYLLLESSFGEDETYTPGLFGVVELDFQPLETFPILVSMAPYRGGVQIDCTEWIGSIIKSVFSEMDYARLELKVMNLASSKKYDGVTTVCLKCGKTLSDGLINAKRKYCDKCGED